MEQQNKIKEAYTEILEVLNKHKDYCIYNVKELESQANKHLFGLKLNQEYGLDIKPTEISSLDYNRFGEYRSIGWWGEKYKRTISWSVDEKQLEDELLFVLNFSTGAYIFGEDYPKELFQEFWQELKSYEPKYCDDVNHGLFFSMSNASKLFNSFNDILKKYLNKNKEQAKDRKIEKLKKELEKLETI